LRWLLVKFVEPGWIEARVPVLTRDGDTHIRPTH
jgi:hypothetical protein